MTFKIPGQNVPIQLKDGQIEPVWYDKLRGGFDALGVGGFPGTNLYLQGFEPARLSGTTIRLPSGVVANSNGTALARSTGNIDIDITDSGPLGLDTGAVADGVDYFIYLLRNRTMKQLSGVFSASITYGGVTVPTGYEMWRKLPVGFVYDSSKFGGIPTFHVSHWPSPPKIMLTGSSEVSGYRALTNGTDTSYTNIDLTNWLPDNARMAHVLCVAHATGTSGTAYLRSANAVDPDGLPVGSPTPSQAAYLTRSVGTTSTRQISYKVTGGADLSVYVLGYDMTENS